MPISVESGAIMKNEHIELVKKWLEEPSSVSQAELKNNYVAADDTLEAAWAADAVQEGALNAVDAAQEAAWYAANDDSAKAAHWVELYEGMTNG